MSLSTDDIVTTMTDIFAAGPAKRPLDDDGDGGAPELDDDDTVPPLKKKRREEVDEESEPAFESGTGPSLFEAIVPDEIAIIILESVPCKELPKCRLVCKRWSRLVFGTIDYPYPPDDPTGTSVVEYKEDIVEARTDALSVTAFVKTYLFTLEGNGAFLAAAMEGNLDRVRWFHVNGFRDEGLCSEAASSAHLHVIRWAVKNGYALEADVLETAINEPLPPEWYNDDDAEDYPARRLRTIEWLLVNGCPLNEDVAAAAASMGDLDLLKRLRDTYACPWNENTTSDAANNGHLDVFKWAIHNGCPYDVERCIREARERDIDDHDSEDDDEDDDHDESTEGTTETKVARVLLADPALPWNFATFRLAIRFADTGILERRGITPEIMNNEEWPFAMSIAARSGHEEVVKFLHDSGIKLTEYALGTAIGEGHINVVRWMLDNGCPRSAGACTIAAYHGRAQIFALLCKARCPSDEQTVVAALKEDHFEILEMMHVNCCRWDGKTACEIAIDHGYMEMAERLIELNPCLPGPP